MSKPVIVTVRHPDFANDAREFGEVAWVDIDLGSSFDGSKIGPGDWDTVLEWAQGVYDEAAAVEKHSTEAAEYIRSIAEEYLAQCLPANHDGCAVAEYIRGEKTLQQEAPA